MVTSRMLAAAVAGGLLAAGCGTGAQDAGPAVPVASAAAVPDAPGPAPEPPFEPVPGGRTATDLGAYGADSVRAWRREAPAARRVRIASTIDAHRQRAMWVAPDDGGGTRPLLVVLHSWSAGYRQQLGIPFARWAADRGWAMLHPDFRGRFDDPAATGSHLAVQDVVDAVDWAVARGGVDPDRVYLIGFSGGGMMGLLLAGRHPERFAGVASWVPVHDLVDWSAWTRTVLPSKHYASNIADSCGGDPARRRGAREACLKRSPRTHLGRAREAGVPVYLGTGLADRVVAPDAAMRAFNQLARPRDRLSAAALRAARENRLPPGRRPGVRVETFFTRGDPDVLWARRSGAARLVIFEGGHDMVLNPGLRWIARLADPDR